MPLFLPLFELFHFFHFSLVRSFSFFSIFIYFSFLPDLPPGFYRLNLLPYFSISFPFSYPCVLSFYTRLIIRRALISSYRYFSLHPLSLSSIFPFCLNSHLCLSYSPDNRRTESRPGEILALITTIIHRIKSPNSISPRLINDE